MSGEGISDIANEHQIIEGGEIAEVGEQAYRVDPIKTQKAATTRRLAYLLVIILAASVVLHYGVTIWLLVNGMAPAAEAAKSIFTTWLPVISGLAGSAVTYYFAKED